MGYKRFTNRQEQLLSESIVNPAQSFILMYIYDMIRLSITNRNRFTNDQGEIYCIMADSVLTEKVGLSRSTINRGRTVLIEKGIISHTIKSFNGADGFKRTGSIYTIRDKALLEELGL